LDACPDEKDGLLKETPGSQCVDSVSGGRCSSSLRFWEALTLYFLAICGLGDLVYRLAVVAREASVQHTLSVEHHSPPTVVNGTQRATPPRCICGRNVTDAIARGCKYDSLAAAWLPDHCRDDELTEEFERAGPGPNGRWTYYSDANHTIEMDIEKIALMGGKPEFRFYMSRHWHVVHCIFYWRKQFRTRFNGKIVETRSDNEEHIEHCGKVILEEAWGTEAGVALNT
jgi:hypothetical protein